MKKHRTGIYRRRGGSSGTKQRHRDYIWIEGGVIDREIERQATMYGKGSHVEGEIEMMKRTEFTPQKTA
jgi:hypothetical protein